ncbi:MAG: NADH-quinone oxidoreductase subunit C [Bacteroidia bacterium]
MALTHEQVLEKLQGKFAEDIISQSIPYGMMKVEISASKNVDIIRFLRDDDDMQFIFLTDLCGVHMPEQKGKELGVVVHLHSLIHNYRLRLVCWMPENAPEVNSLTGLYAAANWMERETYDFFGIKFTDHPDLRRILNVDHMDYFPLLKQYPLEDSSREDKDDRFFGR